jgi:hypothetical protein
MDFSNLVEVLNKEALYKQISPIDDKFYDDMFLNIFDDKHYVLELKNYKIKYKYEYTDQSGGSKVNDIKQIKVINEHINLLNERYVDVANLEILYSKFFKYVNENHYNYKSPIYNYTHFTYFPYVKTYPKISSYNLNSKYIIQSNNMIVILDVPIDKILKHTNEYSLIILESINKLKMKGNMMIKIHYYPESPILLDIYMILLDTFENMSIIFPLYTGDVANRAYFILKNKIKNPKMPNNKKFQILIENIPPKIKNKFMELQEKIINYLLFIYELQLFISKLKLNKDFKYKVIKNKILSKLISL